MKVHRPWDDQSVVLFGPRFSFHFVSFRLVSFCFMSSAVGNVHCPGHLGQQAKTKALMVFGIILCKDLKFKMCYISLHPIAGG